MWASLVFSIRKSTQEEPERALARRKSAVCHRTTEMTSHHYSLEAITRDSAHSRGGDSIGAWKAGAAFVGSHIGSCLHGHISAKAAWSINRAKANHWTIWALQKEPFPKVSQNCQGLPSSVQLHTSFLATYHVHRAPPPPWGRNKMTDNFHLRTHNLLAGKTDCK